MDFSKVQKIRETDRRRRKVLTVLAAVFVCVMAYSFTPWIRTQLTRHGSKASADQILDLLEKEKYHEAYETCLNASLKQQHPLKDFEGTWKNLMSKKGVIWGRALRGYMSKPQGKNYELVTYKLQHERGNSMIDFALEPDEGKGFLVRAYRIEASGL